METPIRLFMIDDHTLLRQGISALLSRENDIEIVGESGDGLNAVNNVIAAKANVVVLDLSLPSKNGLDICRRLVRKTQGISVLILTMHAEEEYVAEAFRSGAQGYLLKESAAEQLVLAVRTVVGGELYLGPGISPEILRRIAERPDDDPYTILTERERHILGLIARGQSNRIIAEGLGLSIKTVDTHRWRLMKKLNIHDQTTLVKYAIRKGLAQLD